MLRTSACALVVMALAVAGLPAQPDIRQGKLKKVDAGKNTVTISTADGKDHELTAVQKTRFMDADGKEVKDGLKDKRFKEGVAVFFAAYRKDDNVLIGMKLTGDGKASSPAN